MEYFYIDPIIAGEMGQGTVMDRSVHPPAVSRLVYEVDGWFGDVVIATFPCYLVTEEAKRALLDIGFSGATFADVTITISDNFREVYSDVKLPPFVWLKVIGRAGRDDFGIGRNFRLVISERVLDVLDELGIPNADIKPLDDREEHT